MRRRTRLFAAWWALLAVLAATLVPTLARAAAPGAPAWAEVCTTDGTRGAPDAAHALEHCPFCSLGGALPLLPTADAAGLPALALAHARPFAAGRAVALTPDWHRPAARAPPRHA